MDTYLRFEREAVALMRTFRGLAERVVAVSSQDVYRTYGVLWRNEDTPPNVTPIDEEAPLRSVLYPYRRMAKGPDDPRYSYDKIPVERVVMSDPGLPATVLRLPATYGPGDRQHRLFEYLKRMDDGRPFIILGGDVARGRRLTRAPTERRRVARRKVDMTRILKVASWVTMTALASLFALGSLRYFVVSPEMAIDPPLAGRFAEYITPLLFHAGGAAVALSLGPWGFWGALRNRYLPLHRRLGRVYLLAVLVGGAAGLYMALTAFGGLPTRFGFLLLALLWLATGAAAYLRIRRGEVRLHREWMIRNYALTFSAVMLRVWLALFLTLGYDFPEAYVTVAWLCWVPNLLVAELIVGGGRRAGHAVIESARRRGTVEV